MTRPLAVRMGAAIPLPSRPSGGIKRRDKLMSEHSNGPPADGPIPVNCRNHWRRPSNHWCTPGITVDGTCVHVPHPDRKNAEKVHSALVKMGATGEDNASSEGEIRQVTGLTEREYKRAITFLKEENAIRTKTKVGTWL